MSRSRWHARSTRWGWGHLPTAVKIDLFILRSSPFDRSEFSRRRPIEIRPGEAIVVKSAEDTVLRKLPKYLEDWAEQLGVMGLFVRARDEAARI
jgi:hypothetical protein